MYYPALIADKIADKIVDVIYEGELFEVKSFEATSKCSLCITIIRDLEFR